MSRGVFEFGALILVLFPHNGVLNVLMQDLTPELRGELAVNGQSITSGDAVLLEQESQVQITNANKAEVLVFDLAP